MVPPQGRRDRDPRRAPSRVPLPVGRPRAGLRRRTGQLPRPQEAATLPPGPQSTEYAPRVIAALEPTELCSGSWGTLSIREGNNEPAGPGMCGSPLFRRRWDHSPRLAGHLPEQCAALNRCQVNVQLLTVAVILERSRDTIYQAAFLDPLLSAQLTPTRSRACRRTDRRPWQPWRPPLMIPESHRAIGG